MIQIAADPHREWNNHRPKCLRAKVVQFRYCNEFPDKFEVDIWRSNGFPGVLHCRRAISTLSDGGGLAGQAKGMPYQFPTRALERSLLKEGEDGLLTRAAPKSRVCVCTHLQTRDRKDAVVRRTYSTNP
jgi:hypothetical protein